MTASKVLLKWNSGHDPTGPVTHQLLVNGVPTPNEFSTLPPAVDQAGNASAASNARTVNVDWGSGCGS